MMRRVVRLTMFVLVCSLSLAGCAALRLVLHGANEAVRLRWLMRVTQWWAQSLLTILDLRVDYRNTRPDIFGEGKLFVANHQSYLDTLVIAAHCPVVFVAKREVSRWPLLGWLASLGGTIFIQRDCPHSNVRAFYQVSRALRQGTNVLVFPEGTTNNGTCVLPFHPFFFAAASRAARATQPLALRYLSVDEAPLDNETRDWLCWHGDMDFVGHFWRLLGLRHAAATMALLEPLPTATARSLASLAQARITEQFNTIAHLITHRRKLTWLDAMKTNALIALKRWT